MKILGIIPARGGSKGIPGKNIKNLCGRPLIAWSILEAKKTMINRLIVSTDSEEIAEVAREYGAEVPFLRPAEISHDKALDIEFINHALDFLKKEDGYEPDVILRLPPTSPLRTAEHINQGIEILLKNSELDAVRPITKAPKHPYKMWKISEDKETLEPFLPYSFTGIVEPYNMPRQLLPEVYVHTGAMDVLRLRTVRELHSTSGNKLGYFVMSSKDSVNIDEEIDFILAELLFAEKQKGD